MVWRRIERCLSFTETGLDVLCYRLYDLSELLIARILGVGESPADMPLDEGHGDGVLGRGSRAIIVNLGMVVRELQMEHLLARYADGRRAQL